MDVICTLWNYIMQYNYYTDSIDACCAEPLLTSDHCIFSSDLHDLPLTTSRYATFHTLCMLLHLASIFGIQIWHYITEEKVNNVKAELVLARQ